MNNNEVSVILFDGVCNLCNSSVNFIIDRDKGRVFRFAVLQSGTGREFLEKNNLPAEPADSIMLIENGSWFTRSTAALRIAKKLSGAWPLLYIFIIIPRFVRDAAYNYIAKNRYKWFGRQDRCRVPAPELEELFLP